MKREKIEKEADQYIAGMSHDLAESDLIDFAIHQINRVLSELEILVEDHDGFFGVVKTEAVLKAIRECAYEAASHETQT